MAFNILAERRLVPGERVELSRDCSHQLLRLARLPFRHPGMHVLYIPSRELPTSILFIVHRISLINSIEPYMDYVS